MSLALPWFALSLAGLGSHGFRVWSFDKGAFVLIAAYGLLALSQISMASRDSMAVIYLIIGGLMTAAFIYKIWISPPGSAPLGDIEGLSGVSAKEILAQMGIEFKASYGAYVAFVGSLLFTFGAFTEFRASGAAKAPATAPAAGPQQYAAPAAQQVPAAQRYQAPAPQTYAPDPFAVPAPQQAVPQAAAAPHIPPDPFAPKPPAA
ncbi:MAG: hypothetical protein JHC98_10110 [Thermoleophilaceae bacterium]|nr:hypothetical protein [Thermoleophilaceae bacterium]